MVGRQDAQFADCGRNVFGWRDPRRWRKASATGDCEMGRREIVEMGRSGAAAPARRRERAALEGGPYMGVALRLAVPCKTGAGTLI